MTTVPNLSSLILPGGARAHPAPVSTQHPLEIPKNAVDNLFLLQTLPASAKRDPGILVSAGKRKKDLLQKFMKGYKPDKTWEEGYLYAYFGPALASDYIVSWCHYNSVSFTLFGGYRINLVRYMQDLITFYWNASGRPGNGSVRDLLMDEVTVERFFYEQIWANKRLGLRTWTKRPGDPPHYTSFCAMMDALLQRGEPLPINWLREGMFLLEKFISRR